MANPTLTGILRSAKSPYNTDAVTQAMATVVLKNPLYHDVYRELILTSRDMLLDGMKKLEAQGLLRRVYDSCTNFVFAEVDNAKAIQDDLADRGIIIRRFGDDRLRITASTEQDNREVLAILQFLLSGKGCCG